MSVFDDFVDGIKDIYASRDRRVRIPKFLYDQLHEEAGNEDEVENLLMAILSKRFQMLDDQEREQQEDAQHQIDLVEYYEYLDRYLFATINRNITIGITNELNGRETSYCNYTLKDYRLSKVYRTLKLDLERNEEYYPISFYEIIDIKFNNNGERLKTWIYMPHPMKNWRFYLDFDPNIVGSTTKSGRIFLTKEDYNSINL
ncbi:MULTISPECIES: hypothetical protein [unclassified Paenibacillus]|uniref:hypothetical protein n=1 Tax=unclassified Paenibacillus TaxID=185978 RepID=UPI001C10EBD5|nr:MULTISPECIES: hypothetical protein [unclassified Paenibacillus]MBU5445667.1 hypothetical protein [Paenibacillus sp. MSJ-34]CAH0122586.1 hypothetical protein PAE9249_05158 [Paenibacillus sp. CECT 9249]